MFGVAEKSGVDAEQIVRAAERYRIEQTGNSKQYVTQSDSWLIRRRWENYSSGVLGKGDGDDVEAVAKMLAEKINAGKYVLAVALSVPIVDRLFKLQLVPLESLKRMSVNV